MTAFPTRITGISGWAFAGVAVTSFGGPLALAALYAPGIVAGSAASAGLAMAAAVAVFAVPLAIWLRYAGQVNGSGGLYSFVEAAAGRPVGLVQAGLWIASYLLYLLYTSAQIVYDALPAVLPGERAWQPLLEIAIPIALAGVMIAGRHVTLLVTGLLAAGHRFAARQGGRPLPAWVLTAAGLLLSASTGLFGYRESLAVPYAGMSLAVEFAGTAVLVAAAAILLAAHGNPLRAAARI